MLWRAVLGWQAWQISYATLIPLFKLWTVLRLIKSTGWQIVSPSSLDWEVSRFLPVSVISCGTSGVSCPRWGLRISPGWVGSLLPLLRWTAWAERPGCSLQLRSWISSRSWHRPSTELTGTPLLNRFRGCLPLSRRWWDSSTAFPLRSVSSQQISGGWFVTQTVSPTATIEPQTVLSIFGRNAVWRWTLFEVRRERLLRGLQNPTATSKISTCSMLLWESMRQKRRSTLKRSASLWVSTRASGCGIKAYLWQLPKVSVLPQSEPISCLNSLPSLGMTSPRSSTFRSRTLCRSYSLVSLVSLNRFVDWAMTCRKRGYRRSLWSLELTKRSPKWHRLKRHSFATTPLWHRSQKRKAIWLVP